MQVGVAQTTTNFTTTPAPFLTTPAPFITTFQVTFTVVFKTLTRTDFALAMEINYRKAVISLIPNMNNETDYNRVTVSVSDVSRRSAGSERRLLAGGIKLATVINFVNAELAKNGASAITEASLNRALVLLGLPEATLTSAPVVSGAASRTAHAWALTSVRLGLTVFYSIA